LCNELKPQLKAKEDSFLQYLKWQATVPSLNVPVAAFEELTGPPPPTSALYHRLLDPLPDDLISVPLVLHCMLEQVEFLSDMVGELATEAAHQEALKQAQAAASADDGAAAPVDPAAVAPVAAAVDGWTLLDALTPAQVDERVTRHWQLLADGKNDAAAATVAAVPSAATAAAGAARDTVVVPYGDEIGLRRNRALLSLSRAACVCNTHFFFKKTNNN
jgi:hypothetical protein